MDDKLIQYQLIYALAARAGREERLFGPYGPVALEAVRQSVAGERLPEIWFEIPLLGEPWLDVHCGTSREDVRTGVTYDPYVCGGHPEAFEWFAAKGPKARQLFLSWDTSIGAAENPAVQLLSATNDPDVVCDFLEVLGRADATDDYRAFVSRIPKGWFPCYVGTFAGRKGHHLRVECIPLPEQQIHYAKDPAVLEADLLQTGVRELGDTIVPRSSELSQTPFRIEFQFDVEPGGTAGPTIGVSLRFANPPGDESWHMYDAEGAAGAVMSKVEEWGLADDRWRLLTGTMFAMRLRRAGVDKHLFCYPAFVKLRWRHGELLDAKSYLVAGVQ